ncbi:MAG TPA: GntR family transcriptional regulator [Bacillota bacterium]|nr:GntR family transcriptional regulator [Bacillota bacterium]
MVKKINKRQYAYQVIRSRIIDGTYVPGQRIVIDQIAKEVRSSHIPVREAIHQLESEKLIDYKPNIGAIVRGIDDTLYMDTLEVLAVLEGYATALSAPHITASGLQSLTEMNQTMKDSLKNYALDQIGELNREFHFTIYSFCPNELLIHNIQDMWERMDVVRKTGFTFFPERTPHSIEEHTQIIKLLRDKEDESTIERYARGHKLNTLKAFKNRQS